ncbi:unnamed protein product [Sphenostylis stenocarpa]|uniref:Uncharacterized protein n=1 Tax=Sphenostylis stenocarpa TaxID=92480 RepID=A0AA86SAH6_9FABA|nr:unnamed protein product [Sphenostylis stenocarpa]
MRVQWLNKEKGKRGIDIFIPFKAEQTCGLQKMELWDEEEEKRLVGEFAKRQRLPHVTGLHGATFPSEFSRDKRQDTEKRWYGRYLRNNDRTEQKRIDILASPRFTTRTN